MSTDKSKGRAVPHFLPLKEFSDLNVLQKAENIVYGDREQTYGSPGMNLERIAEYWNSHLINLGYAITEDMRLTPHDVCTMLILLKLARLQNQPDHIDSIVDVAGYAALMERIHADVPEQV